MSWVAPPPLADARELVEAAFFLRVHGERPPGAPKDDPTAETWQDWDRRAETFLRSEAVR